jgi:hypothetical protein
MAEAEQRLATRHFGDQGAGFLGALEHEMRPFADVVSVLVLQERKQGERSSVILLGDGDDETEN